MRREVANQSAERLHTSARGFPLLRVITHADLIAAMWSFSCLRVRGLQLLRRHCELVGQRRYHVLTPFFPLGQLHSLLEPCRVLPQPGEFLPRVGIGRITRLHPGAQPSRNGDDKNRENCECFRHG